MTETRKKKVLFLITKSNWGGAQRYVFDLATSLPKNQYDVTVALGGDGVLKEKLETEGITTITLSEMKNETSFRRIGAAARELENVLKANSPDVLHINSSMAGIAGVIAGKRVKTLLILFTAHAWAFNEDRSLLQRTVIKAIHWLTVLLAHKTITVSEAVRDQMNWPGVRSRMTVIYNGRPEITFASRDESRETIINQTPDLATHRKSTWTGSIGELHPVKGHDIMIEAVADLVARGHNITHCIIGTGSIEEELRAQIASRNLTEHVFLVGHIDEAARYLRAFDIYIQPSRSEALGYTVVEAAMAKLPIIASNVGGIPEIIEHDKSGLLVQKEDIKELTGFLEQLLESPSRAKELGDTAHSTSSRFSLATMLKHTQAIYDGKSSLT